jgi:hypothetical protein
MIDKLHGCFCLHSWWIADQRSAAVNVGNADSNAGVINVTLRIGDVDFD